MLEDNLATNSNVQMCFIKALKMEKNKKLHKILSAELEEVMKKDSENPKIRRTLVFVELKRRAKLLTLFLSQAGIPTTCITGDMSQGLIESAVKEFSEHRCPVLVTTDACALGIDIKNIDHVINLDLPEALSTFFHRVGRTGRLNKGTITSFYDPEIDNGLFVSPIKKLGWLLK